MKYIFDFDDVLFENTRKFKKNMFRAIAEAGVPRDKARAYYLEVREKEFSLQNFLESLFGSESRVKSTKLYKEIMRPCKSYLNKKLIAILKNTNKRDRYIVTNGDEKFQKDKLKYSGIGKLFPKNNVFIVPSSKKKLIARIAKKYPKEKVLFLDDKIRFIEDLPLGNLPNLSAIQYKRNNQVLRATLRSRQ